LPVGTGVTDSATGVIGGWLGAVVAVTPAALYLIGVGTLAVIGEDARGAAGRMGAGSSGDVEGDVAVGVDVLLGGAVYPAGGIAAMTPTGAVIKGFT
jgi:hypothetical protein